MGKDSDSWLPQQCSPQSPNGNSTDFVAVPGWPNALTAYTNSVNETRPGYKSSELSHLKTGPANVSHGWFYCLPRHRQALTPIPNCAPNPGGDDTPNAVSRPVEKRFLVFDHSGNQTRLVFGPVIGSPIQCPNLGNVRPLDTGRLEEWRTKTVPLFEAGPISSNEENHETGDQSEMHEDTEELNALLYSDDDDDCDCDEEISTGHSPSKMTSPIKEEVASSGGLLKRKRLLDEQCSSSSLMDTASSGKPNGSSEYEDDAESSCGDSRTLGGELGSLPANKRLRREKIRETVNILQNILPSGKGKDALYVLDEAIQYLRSLKLKAKSLGENL